MIEIRYKLLQCVQQKETLGSAFPFIIVKQERKKS